MLPHPPQAAVRPILLVALFALASSPCPRAQAADGADAERDDVYQDDWRWARYTVADGLPDDRVLDVYDDGDEVWALTHVGAAWYDGWRWHTVREGLPQDETFCSLTREAGRGKLWISSLSGLYRGDRDGFERVVLPAPFDRRPIQEVVHLSDGSVLFVVHAESGAWELFAWKNGSAKPFPIPEPLHPARPPLLKQSAGGRAWVAAEAGLFTLEPGAEPVWRRQFPALEGSFELADLVENARGDGLTSFCSPSEHVGLWEWHAGGRPRLRAEEGAGIVRTGSVAPDGTAIVAYDSGEVRMRRDGHWMAVFPVPNALKEAMALRYRPDGDLWVGTPEGLYLHRQSSLRWKQWREPGVNALGNRVEQVHLGADGRVWLATHAGLRVLVPGSDGDRPEELPPLPGLEVPMLMGLGEDALGRVWVSSENAFHGFRVWDGERWTERLALASGEELGTFGRIRSDRAGRLWFLGGDRHRRRDRYGQPAPASEQGESPAACVVVLEGGELRVWEHEDELARRGAYDFVEDAEGRLWFGTSRGVSRWGGSGWKHWDVGEPWQGPINRICLDPEGGAWIGCFFARLARIEPDDSFHVVESTGGFSVFDAFDVAYDPGGRLWVSAMQGTFGMRDGAWSLFEPVSSTGTARQRGIAVSSSHLYVGTLGAGAFELAFADSAAPVPVLTLDEPALVRGRLHLRWSVHTHGGEVPQSEVPTRHRLDGGEWSAWSTERLIEGREVGPGAHRVEVEARTLFGGVTRGEAAFETPVPFVRRFAFWGPVSLLSAALLALVGSTTRRRRRDARALRASEREHRTLLEQASDAIFLVDLEGRIARVNPRAAELLGRSENELIGARLDDLFRDPSADEPDGDLVARLRDCSDRGCVCDLETRDSGRGALALEVSARVLDDGRVQAIVRDLTERRRQEEQRREIERQLTEAKRLESLGLLAGGVAHDFNNLLTVILGSAELARLHLEVGEDVAADVERIQRAARSATGLTHQLLTYAGNGTTRLRPLSLNALVEETASLLETSVAAGTEIVCTLEPNLPLVEGDPAGLHQVVLNLIVNAAESYGEEGGPVELVTRSARRGDPLLAELEPAELAAEERWVVVQVRDRGTGMDSETLARVFDPFFTTKFAGRGLGLASVRGVMRAHGGRIRVASDDGGSVFTLLFPAPKDLVRVHESAGSRSQRLDGVVLVVDDEPSVLETTAAMLRRLGLQVVTAAGGAEACERSAGIAGLVAAFVDLTMPGLGGIDVYRRLRAERDDVAVILTSGFPELEALAAIEGDPLAAFLPKPFTAKSLHAALADLFGRRGEASRTASPRT